MIKKLLTIIKQMFRKCILIRVLCILMLLLTNIYGTYNKLGFLHNCNVLSDSAEYYDDIFELHFLGHVSIESDGFELKSDKVELKFSNTFSNVEMVYIYGNTNISSKKDYNLVINNGKTELIGNIVKINGENSYILLNEARNQT